MPEHPDTQPLADASHTLSGHVLAPVDPDEGPKAGMLLGPYQLLRPLGQGGMGEVWLAQQSAPLKREVAVKLLSRTLNDRIAEAWFLVERQALAMLVHPYIAQIYDAGQLPGGLMFFAMELVDGQTLDRWVCDRLPDLPRLIGVFEKVCQGIQHAHQRGLIHRDLKPANVLVSEHQGEALPKIIDFGVAIGGAQGRAAGTLGTAGTRAYMAPEQAQPDGRGIDARADVYGLGATLAALLCLRLGIRADGAIALSHLQAAQLTGSAAHIGPASDVPQEHSLRLRRMVPKPLRAILLKATASDREARYESAAALAEDLRRWRGGHPVVAMGGGRAYAIACFLRRHRWASAAVGIALLALLGGIGVALYGLGQARQAQSLAEQRRVQAEGLVGVMLGDLADKLRPLGRLDLLETVGDEAMRYLSAASTSSDAGIGAIQRARALRTLGEVYVQRQQTEQAAQAFAEAERTLQQADSDPADLADLLYEQGNVAYWLGYLDLQANDLAGAGQHFGDYLAHAEALQPITAESGLGLLETSYALNNLGTVASRRDQNAEAIDYYERSVALKRRYLESHPDDDNVRVDLADSLSWIGSALASERKPSVARAYFEQQLELTSAIRSARTGESWWIWKEAVATHILARLQVSMGDKAAIDRLAAALDGYAAASRTDPSNRRWAEQVISAQIDVAWATAVLANTASGLSELQAIEQRLKSSAAAGTTDRNLLRVESRLSLLRALDSDCPTEERDRSAGVQSSSDEAPRDLALLLVARGLCSSEVERSQSFQAAEALAELPELRRGDDGLQIKALIAAAEKNKIELSRLTAELERLGYDAERAIRLTRATDSPR